jgi:tRNA pseudouridine55 synthase
VNALRRPRAARRDVHGVLLLDKPLGWSSNDALQKAKGLFRARKAGHTGTLDPLASGLLPICFGAATKFAGASLDADKAYRATLALGVTTSTGDGEGEVLAEQPVSLDRSRIEAACARFVGTIEQMPPLHCALKREGRALYAYARAGVGVEREARRVTIRRIDIVEWQGSRLVIDIECSKGTYIRSLAIDIGAALGCGASLSALRRTASGALGLEGALTLERLAALTDAERDAQLLAPDVLLADAPEWRLDAAEAARFLTGLRRRVAASDARQLRVYGPEPRAFLGSAHIAGGELIADRLLSPPEVQALIASARPS